MKILCLSMYEGVAIKIFDSICDKYSVTRGIEETSYEKDNTINFVLCNTDYMHLSAFEEFIDEVDAVVFCYVTNEEMKKERDNGKCVAEELLDYGIENLQRYIIGRIRSMCHNRNKDFYVIDDMDHIEDATPFFNAIANGYSCVKKAKEVYSCIPETKNINIFDGDKTVVLCDATLKFTGTESHTHHNKFYTGYQFFRQHLGMSHIREVEISEEDVPWNHDVIPFMQGKSIILSSGSDKVWNKIGHMLRNKGYDVSVFAGDMISSETKYYITKFLMERGTEVMAYGDSRNDYFMLMIAKVGTVVASMGLNKNLEGYNLDGLQILYPNK